MRHHTSLRRQIVDHRTLIGAVLRGYALFVQNNVLTFEMHAASGIVTATGAAVPADGQWHFVAVTVNRVTATGRLFVDGSFASFNPAPASSTLANLASVTIGAVNDGAPSEFFNGCIDEVEIFNRELSLAQVAGIRDARQQGKCKHCCKLPQMGFCPGDQSITVAAQIYNKSAYPETYTYGLAGLVSGPSCPLTVALTFPGLPATVVVPPWTCQPITLTVPRPPGLALNQWGCIKLLVQANNSGVMFMCQARVYDKSWGCPHLAGPSMQTLVLTETDDDDRGRFSFGDIFLTNPLGTNVVLNYRINVEGPDIDVISLNGLPPGTPITNSVPLAPDEFSPIEVNGQFLMDDPNQDYDIWIYGDVDGSGTLAPLLNLPVTEIFQARLAIIYPQVDGIQRLGISWSGFGILQSSPALTGPWTDLAGVANPYVIPSKGDNTRFYRLRQ